MARNRDARLLLAATLAVTTSVTPALASPSPKPRPIESFTVTAGGGPHPFTWSWTPDELTIRGRGKVTWENPTAQEHRVAFWNGPGAEKLQLAADGSGTLTLRRPGVYEYRCDILGHSDIVFVATERICVGMCGEITVE